MTLPPIGTTVVRRLGLAAASGLVRAGDHFYVVADDETHLVTFPGDGSAPEVRIRLFTDELPVERVERKRLKPDLEALVLLPGAGGGALLALPSGSTPARRRAALIDLDAKKDERDHASRLISPTKKEVRRNSRILRRCIPRARPIHPASPA